MFVPYISSRGHNCSNKHKDSFKAILEIIKTSIEDQIVSKDEHYFKETSYHMDRSGLLNKINASEGVHMTLKELRVFNHAR